MIQFSVRLFAPPEKSDEIIRAVRCRLDHVRVESGCLGCHLYQDLEDPQVLGFEELWNELADLQRHATTAFFRELLVWVELSTQPPEISFQNVTSQCGVGYLSSLCGSRRLEIDGEPMDCWGPPGFGRCDGPDVPDEFCPLDPGRKRCTARHGRLTASLSPDGQVPMSTSVNFQGGRMPC